VRWDFMAEELLCARQVARFELDRMIDSAQAVLAAGNRDGVRLISR
jgi:hypothetical protein